MLMINRGNIILQVDHN